MRDTELYMHLLGLEKPWSVSKVKLNLCLASLEMGLFGSSTFHVEFTWIRMGAARR